MIKTAAELEKTACLYWPKHLAVAAAEASTPPVLLQTQDKFLSILKSSDKDTSSWRQTLENSSTLSPGLFLKHLMVLSDIGGERLQRFAKDSNILFPSGQMTFVRGGKQRSHILPQKAHVYGRICA